MAGIFGTGRIGAETLVHMAHDMGLRIVYNHEDNTFSAVGAEVGGFCPPNQAAMGADRVSYGDLASVLAVLYVDFVELPW
jgi:lactate dehydrogenase-like 2-hydroxyacid dehydrogenase